MNKNGIISKSLYCSTENNVVTSINVRYSTHTNHIGVSTQFQKSRGFNNGSVTNKNCPAYLGITIAEQVLFNVFKNVERMPYKNCGYDFKCNHGYLIDIKASVRIKNRNSWLFGIHQNPIADYFLCIAFNNRQQLNPLHIWLIPANKINHLKGLGISESQIDKWSEFELTDKLDKVIACCNTMRST